MSMMKRTATALLGLSMMIGGLLLAGPVRVEAQSPVVPAADCPATGDPLPCPGCCPLD
jgi:hypothetical protein